MLRPHCDLGPSISSPASDRFFSKISARPAKYLLFFVPPSCPLCPSWFKSGFNSIFDIRPSAFFSARGVAHVAASSQRGAMNLRIPFAGWPRFSPIEPRGMNPLVRPRSPFLKNLRAPQGFSLPSCRLRVLCALRGSKALAIARRPSGSSLRVPRPFRRAVRGGTVWRSKAVAIPSVMPAHRNWGP